MLKAVVSYALSSATTNYGITNMHNLYNLFLAVLDGMNEEQKEELMNLIILHLGRNFYKGFRAYVMDKLPNSEHLKYINRIV